MMIPTQVVSKMGICELEIKDFQFEVSVIDNAAVMDKKISELRGMIRKATRRRLRC